MKWHESTLEKLIELENGYAFKSDEYAEDGHFLMRITNVQQGYISSQSPKYVSIPANSNLKQYELHEGDLLMSLTGNVGRVGFIEDHHLPAALNQRVARIKIKDTKNIDKRYLFNFFNSVDIRAKIEKLANGAAQLNLSTKDIKSLCIPLPPIAEQQRIAALLDTADRILKQRESAIAKLDQLAQSVFVEMFGSINGNEKKFEQMKLTEFFKFKTGKFDSNAAIENGIYPFFTCSKDDFAINEYAFDEEALLLAGNNATADYSVKHYKGKFNAYQRTYVINLAESNNSYAYAKACLQLKLIQLKSVSKGTNTKYLTMGIFREMTINVPPKNLQIDFEKRIHAIDLVKSKNKEDLKILKKLIDSLQHQSFAVN